MATKVTFSDKVTGGSLSASDVNQLKVAANGAIDDLVALTGSIPTQISAIIGGAPAEYNTLGELAAGLQAVQAVLNAQADSDTFVNTINEVLAVFANYPEGATLAQALADKASVASLTALQNSLSNYVTTSALSTALGLKQDKLLTGYTVGQAVDISATDTVPQALGKLQAQVSSVGGGITPSRTGGVVAFDVAAFYNTPSAPGTFSAFDFTGATTNTEATGWFNNSAQPNFGAGAYVVGNWNPNALNEVKFIYRDANNIFVAIYSAQGTQANNDIRLFGKSLTADQQTVSATAVTINTLSLDYLPNSAYDVEWFLHTGAGAAGLKVGFTFDANATFDVTRVGLITASTTTPAGQGLAVSGTLGSTVYAQGITTGNLICRGKLVTGATGGTLTMQFASATASQTSTIYASGSFMKAFKIV